MCKCASCTLANALERMGRGFPALGLSNVCVDARAIRWLLQAWSVCDNTELSPLAGRIMGFTHALHAPHSREAYELRSCPKANNKRTLGVCAGQVKGREFVSFAQSGRNNANISRLLGLCTVRACGRSLAYTTAA